MALTPAVSLQRPCKYQGPEKPPMCENNHNESKVAKLGVPVVHWGCPKRIGNNAINRMCYGILNVSPLPPMFLMLFEKNR